MSTLPQRWFIRSAALSRRSSQQTWGRSFRPTVEILESRLAPAIYNVNTLLDPSIALGVNPATGVINGTANTVSLRSAIQAANANPGGNAINLTLPGTYKITLAGTSGETDNLAGEFAILPIGGNLTIQNTSGGTAVVDGGSLNNRVFDINPANSATAVLVTMIGFTIQNGLAADPGMPDGITSSGGGIRDQGHASLTLTRMVVTNNNATADGGGLVMANTVNSSWTLTINASVISNNHAGDAGGGIDTDGAGTVVINPGTVVTGNTDQNQGAGVYIDAILSSGTLVGASMNMTGTVVSNNAALNTGITASGGGISNAGNGTMTITNCTISGNFSGGQGGGFSDENNVGTLVVTNSYFLYNSATMDGGGIQEGGPSTTITNTEIKANSTRTGAMFGGGGIFANGITLTITACTIADNTVTVNGGGMELQTTGKGGAGSTITNSIIAGNTALNGMATTAGGGIDAGSPNFTGSLNLLNDTINGNFASFGGGIAYSGMGGTTFGLQNTIVAANNSTTGPDAYNPAGTFTDNGGNLIGVAGAGSGNTGFTALTTQKGTLLTPLNPLLGPLQNNAGPTVGAPGSSIILETEALLAGSPAINKGIAAGAPSVDERTFPRPDPGAGEVPDVGAYELQDAPQWIAVAGGVGGSNEIKAYNAATGTLVRDFFAFPSSFTGGLRVAVADVNSDGIPDIIVGTGPGSSEIKVFNGADGKPLLDFFANFMFNPQFSGGIFVAGGDVNADGSADILVGPDAGGQPEVKVFSGKTGAALYDFFAYSGNITGGVRVALGDVTGDGRADIITLNGPGSAPEVRVFDGATAMLVEDYFVSSSAASNLFVAAGDVTGNLRADVIVSNGSGTAEVRVFDAVSGSVIRDFTAYSTAQGVRVGAVSISPAGYADILTIPGTGSSSEVKVFDGMSLAALDDFFAFASNPNLQDGFFIGGGG